mgnify:CR=1 FL=1
MKSLMIGYLAVCIGALAASAAKTASDISDIERDALALELFLQDRRDHDEHCPFLTWEQPPISVYKETLKSQLPEGCKE